MIFDRLKQPLLGALLLAVCCLDTAQATQTALQSVMEGSATQSRQYAAHQTENFDPVFKFAERRILDIKKLIGGPNGHPAPAIAPYQSCQQLYTRRLQLLPKTLDYKPAYWDDPRNQVAVFLGTMYAPAFYFLSYTGITAYLDAAHQIDPRIELDALRHASAQQRCFIK